MMLRLFLPLLLAAWLAACTTAVRMEGEQVVNHRLALRVTDAWNRLQKPGEAEPYDTWTREGISLDLLRFWGGVKPGQALMVRPMVFLRHDDQKAPRVPTFRSGMAPEQLVSLFEELYATAGTVTVTRMDPVQFAGQRGVRFEFSLTRRKDELAMRGVGWVAVRRDAQQGDELFAATFVAPRLAFYDRLLPQAEAVVRTARVRGQVAR